MEPLGNIEKLVLELLTSLGEDVTRPGLLETPQRVARAYKEWFRGYSPIPFTISTFPSKYTGIVKRKGIPFQSFCEHHMAMYRGTIDFGYIPNGEVIGLSKIPRLFQHYSAKLTIQEELTDDLIDKFYALFTDKEPLGAIIVVTANHSCESSRGVKVDVPTITSSVRGVFAEKLSPREEFLNL